jgi:hypothetical protein
MTAQSVPHSLWCSINAETPSALLCVVAAAAAASVYMVYCLILLVELAPKQHLALGIAVLSAGEAQEQHLSYSTVFNLRKVL